MAKGKGKGSMTSLGGLAGNVSQMPGSGMGGTMGSKGGGASGSSNSSGSKNVGAAYRNNKSGRKGRND